MCKQDQSVHISWAIDSVLHACVCMGCECQLWESDHGHQVTCPAGMLTRGDQGAYSFPWGSVCVRMCLCMGGFEYQELE